MQLPLLFWKIEISKIMHSKYMILESIKNRYIMSIENFPVNPFCSFAYGVLTAWICIDVKGHNFINYEKYMYLASWLYDEGICPRNT